MEVWAPSFKLLQSDSLHDDVKLRYFKGNIYSWLSKKTQY